MIEIAIITALAVLLGITQYIAFKERKDMLDRLMAKNFQEYKSETLPVEPEPKPVDDGLRDLEDPEAREAILNGNQED